MKRPKYLKSEISLNQIEEEIINRFTPEEQKRYRSLYKEYHETNADYMAVSGVLYGEEMPFNIDPADIKDPELRTRLQTPNLDEYLLKTLNQLRQELIILERKYHNDPIQKAIAAERTTRRIDKLRLYEGALFDTWKDTPNFTALVENADAGGIYDDIAHKIDQLSEEITILDPFIIRELDKNPEKYNSLKLIDIIKTEWLDDQGNENPDGLLFKVLSAAKKAKEKESLDAQIVYIKEKGVKTVDFPLDKLNKIIWDGLTYEKDGQLRFALDTEKYSWAFDTVMKKQEPEPLVICTIDFTTLEEKGVTGITKKLTAFDKRVYIAVNGLYAAGYDYITINQIYAVMTNKKTIPNAKDREKINKALYKMQGHVYISNETESKRYNYDYFKYEGALLPYDRATARINGKIADVIRIYRPAGEKDTEPRALPLVQFAKKRGQYTTITTKVFGALSLTEYNLEIEDYLIEQIGHIKHRSINNKMLYSTIFESTNQKTRMQVVRARDKIHDLLEHFKKAGFICDYTEDKDSITIILEDAPRITAKKK